MNRRGFIKNALAGLGMAAVAPALAEAGLHEVQPQQDGFINIQVFVANPRRTTRVDWCGETWNIPEDNGMMKRVALDKKPWEGVEQVFSYWHIPTTVLLGSDEPGDHTMQAAAYMPPGNMVIDNGVIYWWEKTEEDHAVISPFNRVAMLHT